MSKFIDRLYYSWKQESWGVNIFTLLLSSIPVCFISLGVGHYLTHNELPDRKGLFYFGIYSFMLGAFGILSRLIYNSTKGYDKEKGRMAYLASVRGLLQALSVSTDYNRRNLTTLEKKIEDCFFILENADASYIELSVGVGLFEEEKIPGDYIQKVHVYHKYGMEDSVQKMYQQISPEVEKIVLKYELSPKKSQTLRKRFQGILPSKKVGLARNSGFLTRIFQAKRTENMNLIKEKDIHELIYLVFELFCGRSVDVYKLGLKGFKGFSETFKRIEVQKESLLFLQDAFSHELKIFRSHFKNLKVEIKDKNLDNFLHTFFEKLFQKGHLNDDLHFQSSVFEEMEDAWTIYRWCDHSLVNQLYSLYSIYNNMKTILNSLNKFDKEYKLKQENYWKKHRPSLDHDILEMEKLKEPIELNQNQKYLLANDIQRIIKNRSDIFSLLEDQSAKATVHIGRGLRNMSGDIILALGQYVDLEDLNNRFAIENSYSANLGGINLDLTTKTIIDWSEALVAEVEKSTPHVMFKFVDWYMNFKQDTLNKDEVEFFSKNFDVDSSLLIDRTKVEKK